MVKPQHLILTYFRLLAKLQIAKVQFLQKVKGKQLMIVGITGSAGKSSTINACEAALKDYLTVKTTAGLNSESGIPLNILGISIGSFTPIDWPKYIFLSLWKLLINWQTYDVYLVEMGIDGPDEPKNMSYLLKIVQPQIGVFLNVNLVHSLQFDKTVPLNITSPQRELLIKENIAKEKAKLINSLPPTGHALLNLSDPLVLKTTQLTLAKRISLKPISLQFPNFVLPQSFSYSVSAALSLAHILGIDKKSALKSLQENLTLPPGRSSVFKGVNHTTVIDSSYNSSPQASKEMLQALSQFPSPRIAILGDMRELGQQSQSAHQELYKTATKCAETIISVGPETSKYFGAKSIKFLYWWQANEHIKQHLKAGSTILVKGSQNQIFLEEIVKELLSSEADKKLLCRQSDHWKKVKATFRRSKS